MTWFECDKGWFGVPKKNYQRAIYVARRFSDEDIDVLARGGINLFAMMTWAVQNSIPYEISTVEPK